MINKQTNKQTNKIITDITFVVPIYNAEKYLSECLDSLLKQNIDKEILCINDGSTDNSLNILKEYAEKYSEIRIVDKKNEGVSKARNLGINEAKGRYIWFVDSDDYLFVEDMSELIKLADNYQLDLIRGLIYKEMEDGEVGILSSASDKVQEAYCQGNKYAESMSSSQFLLGSIDKGFSPKIWAGFYRLSFLKRNQCYFPNLPISNAEDEYFEMVVFSSSLTVKIFEISIPVYFYRHNPLSSTKSNIKQLEGSLIVFPLILELCDNLEEKILKVDNKFEFYKLLWAVRFVALRLNCAACCDIYLKLSKEDKRNIGNLINQENLFYLEEYKYMLLSSESGRRYFSLFEHIAEQISQLKNILSE